VPESIDTYVNILLLNIETKEQKTIFLKKMRIDEDQSRHLGLKTGPSSWVFEKLFSKQLINCFF